MKKNFLFGLLIILASLLCFNEVTQAQQQNVSSGREVIIDVANVDAATYRSVFSMGYFRNLSMHIQALGGVTVTIWATNDAVASTTSDNNWVDITELITGEASIVDKSGIYFIDTKILPFKFMIKYITSDNTNSLKVINIRY